MYHQLKASSANIVGLRIIGGLTKKQKKEIRRVLERQIGESGTIRLLLFIEPYRTKDPESLLFDLNFVMPCSDKIERLAIVGNRAWERTWVGLFGLFSHIRTKHFDHSERKAAWKWIKK